MEWCTILSTAKAMFRRNQYAKAVMNDVKKSAPRAFVPCPFIGEFKVIDVPPLEKLMSILPSAEYMVYIKITDPSLKVIVDAIFVFEKYH